MAIGIGLGEEEWSQVKAVMLSELQNHHYDYTFLYNILEVTMKLIHKLSHFDVSCDPNKYMTLSNMEHIISSIYDIMISTSSLHRSWYFLSLWSEVPTKHKI